MPGVRPARHRPLPPPLPAANQTQKLISGEPDYSGWTEILKRDYDPARGMNYKALKANDLSRLQEIRDRLARVDVKSLNRDQRLAYWINVYNINSTFIVASHYPIKSIRDLSTDLIKRLNVFDKPWVPSDHGQISLNTIENTDIREAFHDPRVHFAINCAAKSCPPIRTEAYEGSRVNAQLDNQASLFLNGPAGMRFDGNTVHVTKVLDFFKKDFDSWAGGEPAFLLKHANEANRARLKAAGDQLKIDYDPYDWDLNDAS